MFEGQENNRHGCLGCLVLLYTMLVLCIASHIPLVDANVMEGYVGNMSMHIFNLRFL